jgi:CHAT domain-containing protein
MVQALRSLAHLAREKGDFDAAQSYLTRALPIAEAKLGPGDYLTLATYLNLAELASRRGQWDLALDLLRRAAKAAQAQGAAQNARALGLDALLVQALRHAADAQPTDATLLDEAFRAAQRAHETQVGAAVAQMAARFAAGTDAMAGAIRRAQDLKSRVDTMDKLVSAELGKPDAQRNEATLGRLRADYAAAKTDLDAANAALTRNFPTYAELSKPAPLSVVETQALLRPDEALVAYLVEGGESFVFAVSRDTAGWARIPLGMTALNAKVAALRKGLFNDADPTGATTAPFDLVAAHELYATLLGPVEGVIADRPKLIVVPAGALTSMPFHVLVTKDPDMSLPQAQRLRQAAWLIKDKAIFVQPSVSSLRALRRFAKASRASLPFIGFGDPVLKPTPGTAKRGGAMPSTASVYRGPMVDLAVLRNGLPPLPETANELRAVAKALDARASDVHLGPAATVADVQAAPLSNYRVIDFATHGLVGGEVGGLSEPALVLSLPDQPTPDNDGLLTASKVAKLSLDADWAVLSACNTAAGTTPGAEGLSGLARAFFYAGARALLVSNWPVDSDAAVSLTTGAFAALKKDPAIGRAEALRRAMLAMIEDPSAPDNADPSIWAPFEVVGEGGAS